MSDTSTTTIIMATSEFKKIEEKLGEIIMKIGPYKMDNHEHALSVMDNSTKNAEWIKKALRDSVAQITNSSQPKVKNIE